MDIQDKAAIVTGAGSRIGRATALRLANEGASVIVADVNEDGGKETVAAVEDAGCRAAFVRTDVTSPEDVQTMIAAAEETFGGLDILHNNAGILGGPAPFPDAEPASWIPVLDLNLRGVILNPPLPSLTACARIAPRAVAVAEATSPRLHERKVAHHGR